MLTCPGASAVTGSLLPQLFPAQRPRPRPRPSRRWATAQPTSLMASPATAGSSDPPAPLHALPEASRASALGVGPTWLGSWCSVRPSREAEFAGLRGAVEAQ